MIRIDIADHLGLTIETGQPRPQPGKAPHHRSADRKRVLILKLEAL
jgi:hypothetical protein